ncbi:hypothetical protein ASPWEDRAFT_34573 [Aspergillus wentii DTO 134E9]|uniref:Uncharacterized protein n=1 Tax=Aspergillus wentii DTO 134E9 TaxID=1073089 RepID=A0A1L9S1S3_ASPWE|nr:uncharacterized protein ASPWEDRAFT_34573 [Aspergillus wentii DTO 134E9]KAI9930920.1 hypothetical protein MW887_010571 [Aspergillus wentii]OJJ41093.1 hypothetical protein ASPWEDRAFT_34573 [Aspergillus wentii DTO 134E9]
MTTQGPSPLPPTTILSTTPLSQSAAHDFLAAYLDRANTDPALQPNAGISEHGPISRTTASAPNLILHNLKRVQAGLAGEVLGRDLAVAKFNADQDGDAQASGNAEGGAAGENNGGWEDAQKWQQADEEEPPMEVEGAGEADGAIDKEERKRLKKERRQAEKRSKAKGGDA